MKTRIVVVALVLLAALPASAEPPTRVRIPKVALPVALGVNSPLAWLAGSFGASGYVGLLRHHAVRATWASYNSPTAIVHLPSGFAGVESAYASGRANDLGIGWVWYPRKLWQGLTLEAGVVRRSLRVFGHLDNDDDIRTKTSVFAGRALIGWSWRLGDLGFLSLATGASLGHESGTETITADSNGMTTTRDVDRRTIEWETYVRWGVAIDAMF